MDARTRTPHARRLLGTALLVLAVGATPARAAPRDYRIDPEHFSIAFSVEHLGYADTIGLFLKGSGGFVYDEATRSLKSARVVAVADSVFTNHDGRDRHVRDSDFLDAGSHPEIVFEATAFTPGEERDGRLHGRLDGRLTLLGQTRPVTLALTLNKAASYPFGHRRHTLGISARTVIKRSEWGMDYGITPAMVGDAVTLRFEFEALRQ